MITETNNTMTQNEIIESWLTDEPEYNTMHPKEIYIKLQFQRMSQSHVRRTRDYERDLVRTLKFQKELDIMFNELSEFATIHGYEICITKDHYILFKDGNPIYFTPSNPLHARLFN